MKEKLFTVTANDCTWTYYRGSGPGGQKKNKTSNCARVLHEPSGAVGNGEQGRSQFENRKIAWKQMANSPTFQTWCKTKAYELSGKAEEVKKEVEFQLLSNTLVEIESDDGWIPGEQITTYDIKNARE